jgi:hypothetical protein
MNRRQFIESERDRIIDAIGNPNQVELVTLLPMIYQMADKRYEEMKAILSLMGKRS